MSGLYVVERESERWGWPGFDSMLTSVFGVQPPIGVVYAPARLFEIRDCNARDGEWPVVVTLAHETVEFEGRAVPLFEGDVERREWEAKRARRRRGH